MLKVEITSFTGAGLPVVVTPDDDDAQTTELEDRPRPILQLVKNDD